eukprot:775858-Rhodomonas_salina.1
MAQPVSSCEPVTVQAEHRDPPASMVPRVLHLRPRLRWQSCRQSRKREPNMNLFDHGVACLESLPPAQQDIPQRFADSFPRVPGYPGNHDADGYSVRTP